MYFQSLLTHQQSVITLYSKQFFSTFVGAVLSNTVLLRPAGQEFFQFISCFHIKTRCIELYSLR